MLHIEMTIGGKVYHHTTRAQLNSSIFCTIPKAWPLHKGDMCDTRINYATVPVRPSAPSESADDHPRTED